MGASTRDELAADQSRSAAALLTGLVAQRQFESDVDAAFTAYEQACDERRLQEARAARRQPLQAELSAREAAEAATAAARARRAEADGDLASAAKRCGIDVTDLEEAANGLRQWQQRYEQAVVTYQEQSREYAKFEALLGGETLESLEASPAQQRAQAVELAGEFAGFTVPGADVNLETELITLAGLAQQAEVRAAKARTLSDSLAKDLPTVGEAEEALAAAELEWQRVNALNQTLSRTLGFLRQAEQRVHRDIAPVLADGIRRRLPVNHPRSLCRSACRSARSQRARARSDWRMADGAATVTRHRGADLPDSPSLYLPNTL